MEKNTEVDIVIVGAGIAGIFSAYILAKAGLTVVVLEKNSKIAEGVTASTTAFVTKIIDTSFRELVNIFGKDRAELVWESGEKAIRLIEEIVESENIECEFVRVPAYLYAKNTREFAALEREYQVLQKSGIEARLHGRELALGFLHAGCLEIPEQAKFDAALFCEGLMKAAKALGVEFRMETDAVSLEANAVKTKRGLVRARNTIIATHVPMIKEGTRFRKAKYVSYAFALEIAKGVVPEGLYLGMDNPYHYFRVDKREHFDSMIIGGEDHRQDIKIQPEKNFRALEKFTQQLLGANAYKITGKWRGQILESIDGLPLIGQIRPHVLVETAFSGNGMTYSAVAATVLRDIILDKENPCIDVYRLGRIPTVKQMIVKGKDYGGMLLGGAVKNWFSSRKR